MREHYASCFWFRHPDATVDDYADVRFVIKHLREYGDKKTWQVAQELHKCL